jgi:elongation factor 2
MNGSEIKVSNPIVPFKETITTSSPVCLTKSPNKLNRLFITAEPLHNELINDIEFRQINIKESSIFSRRLIDKYNWVLMMQKRFGLI